MNKKSYLILMLSFILAFTACQEEKDEIIDFPLDQVFAGDSQLAMKTHKIALRDGSFDNIIDKSSCISVTLPVTIIANGIQVEIITEEDFFLLEKIFDEDPDDNDTVVINFPIIITLSDHSEITIESESQLEELVSSCSEQEDEDNECVDFEYPITISVFDSKRSIAIKHVIGEDKGLFDLLEELEKDDLISIEFPINVILWDGSIVQINNNQELEDDIDMAEGDCDEDDDNDHNDDDVDDTDFIAILVNADWEITSFIEDKDETEDFKDFVFTFNADNTAIAIDGVSTINGTWESNGDSGFLELALDFGNEDPLKDIGDTWDVVEFSANIIKLSDVSGGDGSVSTLVFEKK